MSMFCDRQIKRFSFFIILYSVLMAAAVLWSCRSQMADAKTVFTEHDRAIASALLDQGVSREVIANAVVSTKVSAEGAELLKLLGVGEDTVDNSLPYFSRFAQRSSVKTGLLCLALVLVLSAGTFRFLWGRNRLFRQANEIVEDYRDNSDYSRHLPQGGGGEVSRLFDCVEQLAAMLRAQGEAEHRTKEFLKSTISDISHQLKTPLAALAMYQEIIENEPDNTEIVKEFNAKTGIALNRMEQLILSMLKITRLDAGNISFEKTVCPVKEVVEQAVNELTTRALRENKQIILSGDPDETILCDRDWTCEAVGNLVKNALDHTESGGIISISWERTPLMFRLSVEDDGSGIAPEDIHHIFKRFYRSSQSLDTPGIGLGLPLAKSIIEGQEGVISVESELHRGTTFTLSFLTKL